MESPDVLVSRRFAPGFRLPTRVERWAAGRIQQAIAPVGLRFELWDGRPLPGAPADPVAALVVGDAATLLGLVVHRDLWFGEAYMNGRLIVRGDLYRALAAMSRVDSREPSWPARMAAALASPNTPASARDNVHDHYDLGNDFYRLWLDRELVYTCAYFERPDETLEAAQQAKLDLVCRKLQLAPGEEVVEAGCGWGALALYMAREYGVRVKAFNVSHEQITYARERAGREGLAGRIEFIEDDYREIQGTFDAFVSVGMLEHVGRGDFTTLGRAIRRILRPQSGRGLLHFIGRDAPRPLNPWIRKRIFPGAYPPTLAEVTTHVLAPAGMSVLDVENLRLHYARTLEHWSMRFAEAHDEVRTAFGEEFRRAWELYLAGSRAAFETGWLQLFQVVFGPADLAPPYWTRAAVYHADRRR